MAINMIDMFTVPNMNALNGTTWNLICSQLVTKPMHEKLYVRADTCELLQK